MTRKETAIATALVLLGVACVWIGVEATVNRDGLCVRSQSSEARPVNGNIRIRNGGIFRTGIESYVLYYPGRHEHSGRKCKYKVWVTEREYNRVMYGKEGIDVKR